MGYQRIPAETLAKLTPDRLNSTSVRKLATEFNISKSAVHKLRVAGSKPAKKGQIGRPMKSTQAQRKAIKSKAERSGGGTRKLAEWCADRGYPRVSRGTVGAVVKGGTRPLSFKSVKSGRRLSDRNKSLRLKFVNKCLRASRKLDLDHTVFIDQKSVCMGFDEAQGYSKRWQKEGSRHIFAKSSNPQTFTFYAAVAKGHKSDLVMVPMEGDGKSKGACGFNSATFIMVMKELWEEVKGWYPEGQPFRVVLDHAKQHVSKLSKAELAEMGVPLLEGFPPQSYDLNLIEVAWAHLQQQLLGRRFKNKKNYEKEIREAWGRVKQDTIDQLVGNHMQQFQMIKDAGGDWVKYKHSGGWCVFWHVTRQVPLIILAYI